MLCENCNNETSSNDKYCGVCGVELKKITSPKSASNVQGSLSGKGRLRRLWYGVIVIVWFLAYSIALAIEQSLDIYMGSVFLYVFFIGILIMIASKRCHDFDKSGSNAFLLLVPIYCIYYFFYLIFKKGTNGPNRYGADPKGVPKKDIKPEF